jgi:hypothetical protein
LKDPLPRLKAQLAAAGTGVDTIQTIEKEIAVTLDTDQAWALAQPFLSVEEATDHVMIPLESTLTTGA